MRQAMENIPGLQFALRAVTYWTQEAFAYGMTKRPNVLKVVEALGRWNIRRSVQDNELRDKLTPHYRIGCKRILCSSTYYQAVAGPKSELVTERITRITPDGILTDDGAERGVDVIVFATGFHVNDYYTHLQIKGLPGEDLVDRWNREGREAHRGITVAGMPNLFLLFGPNTVLGHNSVVFMIESQVRYVMTAIAALDKAGAQALAPTRTAQDRFNAELQRKLARSVWNTGGCSSFYLDEHGNNRALWGGYTWQYRLATRALKPKEYTFFGVGAHPRRAATGIPQAAETV
jgi:cation diffusion facilitator CzcD-associated flavoprotein CzcO